ncbi:MAG: HpcH/HpaI aldolase/citrate lyase family protein [Pseudomonadota bacterium]
MLPRTYLFVPGNRPERFAKALASGADAVVIDLEDAVQTGAKSAARDAIARWSETAAEEARGRVVVRINDARSNEVAEDLRLLQACGLTTAMLPKAESAEQIALVRGRVTDARVLALMETARGVANVHEVARAEGVGRLVFGTLDYALDLDLDIADASDGLSHAASVLALASRVAELPAPIAGVTPQIDDRARLLSDLAWARRHGFGAKLCIHPAQVQPIHEALAPDASALDWARRVLAAEAASPGAAQLDGRMIDLPVVLQARRLLQRAPH